jgi:hypothetical protein
MVLRGMMRPSLETDIVLDVALSENSRTIARAGFLEKAGEGAHPQLFRLMLRDNQLTWPSMYSFRASGREMFRELIAIPS